MRSNVLIVEKPWGREIIYALHRRYVGKIIEIDKGHRLSLHYHRRKHETFYALKGRCRVRLQKGSVMLRPGQAFTITPGLVHRLEAPFGRVVILEAATGHAKDLVRLADDYGRKS